MIDRSPEQQFAGFLARYEPAIEARVMTILPVMRALLPGALELVYDNYQFLVVGYGPTERASDAVLSIAIAPAKVNLCFLQNGPVLPDPHKLLRGGGNVVRNIILAGPETLAEPAVLDLIREALVRAKVQLDPDQARRMIIKSISAKQRPRRPKPGKAA